MVDLDTVPHHQSVEDIANLLCVHCDKDDPQYFRVLASYYMGVMAGTMRAKINSKQFDNIPINNYVVCLAGSGYGKGKSTTLCESILLSDFRKTVVNHTGPDRAEQNMWKMALERAALSGNDEQNEYDKLVTEYNNCGEFPFIFDGGTEPAIKQMRDRHLMADSGAINLQVDEIGLNLSKIMEALITYLELYDQGQVKPKITKNSSDNKRTKELHGKTPTNMLLFGTPSRLLDSGPIEKLFFSLLEAGYGRRCLFAFGNLESSTENDLTSAEIFAQRTSTKNDQLLETWRQHFASLADPSKLHWTVDIPDDVSIELIEYERYCKERAAEISEFKPIHKAEMTHRYFKALKVAASFAFVEESMFMTMDQLHSAMKLVEEASTAFEQVMNREASYMKLARYIVETDSEKTHADLADLPFYPSTNRDRQDMITMATAWGWKHHMVIKTKYVSNKVEVFTGETLKKSDMDALHLSWSDHFATGYTPEAAPFDQLHLLTQQKGINWCAHAFQGNHRNNENAIPGFNLIVLDVDGQCSLAQAHELLKDYTFMTYTTKRHTPDINRFRVILPMPFTLELDVEEYREFMQNIRDWLPFEVDKAVKEIAKKWGTFEGGTYHYNKEKPEDQNLIDILRFIPNTSKNDEHRQSVEKLASLDNLERWFLNNTAEGNRNNQLHNFARALIDDGLSHAEIKSRVIALNAKLGKEKIDEKRLHSTVLQTVAKQMQGAAV